MHSSQKCIEPWGRDEKFGKTPKPRTCQQDLDGILNLYSFIRNCSEPSGVNGRNAQSMIVKSRGDIELALRDDAGNAGDQKRT